MRWLDAYGRWHCAECDPPASLAMVRAEHHHGDGSGGGDDGAYPIDLTGRGFGRWRVERRRDGGRTFVREGFEVKKADLAGGW